MTLSFAHTLRFWLALVLTVAFAFPALAQDPDFKSLTKPPKAKPLPPITEYMGREVAQYMHFSGAWWLIRKSREQEEAGATMLKNLGVEPGMTVCDLGCGNGYHTIPMAKIVGEKGKVYGVDIQPEMLRLLEAKAKEEKVKNIEVIHNTPDDPRLPAGKVDIVLLVDVYHEFSRPEEMLAGIRNSLSPKGRLVLVEFRAEDPKVLIRPEHKMTKVQVKKELTANGFKLVKEFDELPSQHMLFFGRDEDWKPGSPRPGQPAEEPKKE